MKAAWYEKQGAARDVLVIGEMEDPHPSAGEVRIRVAFSGVNPGDVKKREDAFGVGMPFPCVIPHSDGSGTVDAVGDGVSQEWVGGMSGVTALNLTVHWELPPRTPCFP
jgi:NADPH2:quinone reductase